MDRSALGGVVTGRLVVVSNRIPTDAVPSGGLVVALHECLSDIGGLWVGCAPGTVEVPSLGLTQIGDGPYRRMTFDITEEEQAGYYLGYANSVLWPLFHRRADLLEYDATQAEAYLAVNARLARLLAAELQPDDRLWIHDYHFLPLALELRKLGATNRIGFFLHTPYPLAADLQALPQNDVFHDWIAALDVVGLQTERDVSALLEGFRQDTEAETMLSGRIRHDGRIFSFASFPIGIDVDEFAKLAADNVAGAPVMPKDQKLIIGVDRLDYSKGLVERFAGFGAYLDLCGPSDPVATLLQIAALSRADVDAYRDIRAELETMSGRVNGAHATLDWTPIRYISRAVPRDRIAGLMRRADACLVTPLADGMNLVAKEFVAAQDPDDPGVLILSHFAGAVEQLQAALTVNPYDTDGMADAIARAVAMPRPERRARHAEMMGIIRERDIGWWTRTCLQRLSRDGPVDAAPDFSSKPEAVQ